MKLTWLGHACFMIEHEGYCVVADPYLRVEGYPHMRATANAVTCSHQHLDHNGTVRVELVENDAAPISVRSVEVFHDEKEGALRGRNLIHIYSAGGMNVAHLGDLGHVLTEEQVAAIGAVDAVMIPVGGFYTIDAEDAKAICDALKPRIVIPMHYRHDGHGLAVVAGVEPFLALWGKESVHREESNTIAVTEEKSGVWVPTYHIPE